MPGGVRPRRTRVLAFIFKLMKLNGTLHKLLHIRAVDTRPLFFPQRWPASMLEVSSCQVDSQCDPSDHAPIPVQLAADRTELREPSALSQHNQIRPDLIVRPSPPHRMRAKVETR